MTTLPELGRTEMLQRTFQPADLAHYARLTDSPLMTVVPAPLIASLFSCLLGTRLPGRGTNWLKQRIAVRATAYIGERLTATVEVVRTRPEKALVNLRTLCTGADGRVILDGEALVLMREMQG